jgi:hypothetical protein
MEGVMDAQKFRYAINQASKYVRKYKGKEYYAGSCHPTESLRITFIDGIMQITGAGAGGVVVATYTEPHRKGRNLDMLVCARILKDLMRIDSETPVILHALTIDGREAELTGIDEGFYFTFQQGNLVMSLKSYPGDWQEDYYAEYNYKEDYKEYIGVSISDFKKVDPKENPYMNSKYATLEDILKETKK